MPHLGTLEIVDGLTKYFRIAIPRAIVERDVGGFRPIWLFKRI